MLPVFRPVSWVLGARSTDAPARHRAGARRWRGAQQQMKAPWFLRRAAPVPWSFGNAASKPSTRNRFMSTNCRDSSARPVLVVTAAERITIVKNCYRLEKIKLGRRRGWLAVARTKSPGLPLRLFWCVRRRSKRGASPFALPRGLGDPRVQAPRGGGVSRARGGIEHWARAKKAQQARQLRVGAPCNKRVLRGWSRLFVASVLPLAWGGGRRRAVLRAINERDTDPCSTPA